MHMYVFYVCHCQGIVLTAVLLQSKQAQPCLALL